MVHSYQSIVTKTLTLITVLLFVAAVVPTKLVTVSADTSPGVQLTPMAPIPWGSDTGDCIAYYVPFEDPNDAQYPASNYTASTKLPKNSNGENNGGFESSPPQPDSAFYIRNGMQSTTTLSAVRSQDYFVNDQGKHVSTYTYVETAPPATPSCTNRAPNCKPKTATAPTTFSIPAGTSINFNVTDYCTDPDSGQQSQLIVDQSNVQAYTSRNAVYPNNSAYSFPTSGTNYKQIVTYHAPINCYGSADTLDFRAQDPYGLDSPYRAVIHITSTQPKGGTLPLCKNVT